MLIFYDPTIGPPHPIRQVIDDHPDVLYTAGDGTRFDLRQPGLQVLILDGPATAALLARLPSRGALHQCSVELRRGSAVLVVPDVFAAPTRPPRVLAGAPRELRRAES